MNQRNIIDKKILYQRDFDGKQVPGRLIYQFELNKYNRIRNIGLIYYKEKYKDNWDNYFENLVFKYIDIDYEKLDDKIIIYDEKSIYPGNNKEEIVKNNGILEYFISNDIYQLLDDPGEMNF